MSEATEVYWNATRKLWSLRRNGRVVGHAKEVMLTDVTLVIKPKARDRVRRTGRKEVHAFARGTVTETTPRGSLIPARYNPKDCDQFFMGAAPISGCKFALLTGAGRMFVQGAIHDTAALADLPGGPL